MRILIAAVATTLLAAPVARAADLDLGPLRGTGYSYGSDLASVADWSGVYIGGFGGYAQTDFNDKIELKTFAGSKNPVRLRKDAQETAFGGFVGYNYQIEEVVLGGEVDYAATNLRGTSSPYIPFDGSKKIIAATKLTDYGMVRIRAGYTLGSIMPFVSAGLAVGSLTTTAKLEDGISSLYAVNLPLSKNTIAVGYTAGIGLDYMITENVFLRGEYQYAFFDDFNGRKFNLNVVRGGAGVKF